MSEESVTNQHKMVILDICVRRWKNDVLYKVTWWLGDGFRRGWKEPWLKIKWLK